jgi:hypothetical protein
MNCMFLLNEIYKLMNINQYIYQNENKLKNNLVF